MKKQTKIGFMFMFLLAFALFISAEVSAITLSYESNDKGISDMKVKINNAFFFDLIKTKEIGTLELKSHKNIYEKRGVEINTLTQEVNPAGIGLIYETNFNEEMLNGLTNVKIIDMKTKKEVQRDWRFVYSSEGQWEIPIYKEVCPEIKEIFKEDYEKEEWKSKNCEWVFDYYDYSPRKIWNIYNNNNIPKGKLELGIEIEVKKGDNLDIVLEIGSKSLTKHAQVIEGIAGYIYAAGAGNQSVIKYDKDFNIVAVSPNYSGNIYSIAIDGDYVYYGGQTTNIVRKAYKTNLSTIADSPSYGGIIRSIAIDEDYVYYGGSPTDKVRKAYKTNLTTIANSPDYGGTILSIAIDEDYVYYGGATTQTVRKAYKTNLTTIANSPNYGGDIYSISLDDDYVYYGGETTKRVRKAYKTNLTTITDSPSYGGDIRSVSLEKKSILVINLFSPENNLQTSKTTINFNATITPTDATIKNVTLYLNENEYLDLYDTNETINYSKILTLEEGDYTWNITTCWIGLSTEEDCTESETRTFEIDTTLPNITVTSGNGTYPYYYSGINHTVNFTIEDDNLDSGWYSYNGTNKSITPLGSGDNNSIIFSVEEGTYNLTIYANDTFGNVASKEVEWDYLIFEDAIGFNQKTFTTKEENFYLNFTTPTAILPVVYLEYNGTEYLSTRTGTSTNHQISNALIPNTIGNISFRWKITWGTNTVYTPYYTQTVQSVSFLNFTSGNCAAGLTNVMNFIFKDESNQTALTNLNIKYNFEYGITGGTGAYSYGSLNAVTKLALCINTSEAPTYEIGYGEIEYVQTGYTSRRYYLFDRTKLTNVTTNTTLYSLPNGDSTSFLVEIRSPTLQPYVDIYTSLLRWYPDLNEYKIVEMGNTDNKGQTVYKVKIEDVDYRIGIYNKNGSLIYLINPVRMVCLASPCSYTINVPVTTRDYLEETLEFEALIEYSDGVFTLTYNDPSQNTELIRFVVTQFSGIDDNTICETNGTSFTGILTCNVSGYEGTLKAVAYRTASPENPIALKIVEIGETVFQGTFGLFLQFLISITLAFLGIINPMTAIILGLIAMVFGVMVIKTITYPILIAISVLGGIIIYMMRRNT